MEAEERERPLLDDARRFHKQLDLISTLRVCCCCGEERGSHEISDCVYEEDDELLEPLGGVLVRAHERSESREGAGGTAAPATPLQPLRLCISCRLCLRANKMRPANASKCQQVPRRPHSPALPHHRADVHQMARTPRTYEPGVREAARSTEVARPSRCRSRRRRCHGSRRRLNPLYMHIIGVSLTTFRPGMERNALELHITKLRRR